MKHIRSSCTPELPACSCLCIHIDDFAEEELQRVFELIISSKHFGPFCLSLSGSSEARQYHKSISSYLIPLTYHLQYQKDRFGQPIFVLEQENAGDADWVTTLKREVCQQGFTGIQQICYPLRADQSDRQPVTLLEVENIEKEEAYFQLLKAVCSPLHMLVVPVDSPEGIVSVGAHLCSQETKFSACFPQVNELLLAYQGLEKEYADVHQKYEVLHEKFTSVNRYPVFDSRSEWFYEKKITELLTFYNKEYEILPLWYKKLGQIIKVFSGKRTFRSLFNDNVKKYTS